MTETNPCLQYFGTAIEPRSFDQWLEDIAAIRGANRRRHLSGHHNLHSLYLLQRDASVAEFYRRCDDCYIDGMPVRLILAGFGESTAGAQRFSLMDHFPQLLAHAQAQGWRVFYLGSSETVAERARALVSERYPRLQFAVHHGYARDHGPVVAQINAMQPDLLLVGMGMPTQERWLLHHLDQLEVGCATQAGATLDYFTGAQAQPPRWMSRAGLAWLYRLACDPLRLWRRYLLEPWALLRPTLRQWYRHRSPGRT
ncbi:MAG: glycosyltransferase [Halioglobus sp.]|nr:glycosyltransferase [Halioglobus sp.]